MTAPTPTDSPTARLDLELMIVGSAKSGTSTLLDLLRRVEGLNVALADEFGYLINDDEFSRGAADARARYFDPRLPDSCPRVAKLAGLMYGEPAIERLLADSPQVRMVAVLRNPVDRAYSGYWYARRSGFEPAETFELALEREAAGPDGLPRPNLRGYLDKGEYAKHLQRLNELSEAAGGTRVEVVLMESLIADPAAVLERLLADGVRFDPAGLSSVHTNTAAEPRSPRMARLVRSRRLRSAIRPLVPQRLRRRLDDRVRSLNERDFRPPPMSEATRGRLLEHFKQPNARLADGFALDLAGWES